MTADVTGAELTGDYGGLVEGVMAECTRCPNTAEAYGTSTVSIRRCLVMLRETCLRGEQNFYYSEQDE